METQETLIGTGSSRLFVVNNFTENYFDRLQKEIGPLLQHEPEIKVYGRVCNQRRNVGFFSNESVGYMYSGQTMKSQPLDNPLLKDILKRVNKELGTNFNGILVNEYINGEKIVGAHSDDERGLGITKGNRSCVAGICYGAIRKFRVRSKKDGETGKIVLDHNHQPCSLLVMDGDFQKEFTHEIPQQKRIKDSRISLTFRYHTK